MPDAYIATVNDDQALREKTAKLWAELNNAPILPEHINCVGCRAETAKLWAELNNAPILPEHINCVGCRADGVKTVFCEHMCEIRKCALNKDVSTCGECPELEICGTVGTIISNNPAALGKYIE